MGWAVALILQILLGVMVEMVVRVVPLALKVEQVRFTFRQRRLLM